LNAAWKNVGFIANGTLIQKRSLFWMIENREWWGMEILGLVDVQKNKLAILGVFRLKLLAL